MIPDDVADSIRSLAHKLMLSIVAWRDEIDAYNTSLFDVYVSVLSSIFDCFTFKK